MRKVDKFRKQSETLIEKVNEARRLFSNHKPSIGYVGEHTLRQTIQDISPKEFGVCQGFICNSSKKNSNEISQQCDIIIYRKVNKAEKYSAGELKIIYSNYVIAVIEVKTSIKKETFFTTLDAFVTLSKFGIKNRYIFIFGSISKQSLNKWFSLYKLRDNKNDNEFIVTELYDWSDIQMLPNSILSLKSSKYYVLDHVQDDNNDYIGYISYKITNKENKEICSLQEFFATLATKTKNTRVQNIFLETDSKKYSVKDGFPLFLM